MKIRYVGHLDEVEVTALDGATVKRNHQIEAPDDVAGHPPEARLAEAMDELVAATEARDHALIVKLREEISGLDYGSGLLAQTDAWQAAATPSKKKDEVPA